MESIMWKWKSRRRGDSIAILLIVIYFVILKENHQKGNKTNYHIYPYYEWHDNRDECDNWDLWSDICHGNRRGNFIVHQLNEKITNQFVIGKNGSGFINRTTLSSPFTCIHLNVNQFFSHLLGPCLYSWGWCVCIASVISLVSRPTLGKQIHEKTYQHKDETKRSTHIETLF